MSITLLELLVAGLLLGLAWQIGVAVAPQVFRSLHAMKREVDEVSDALLTTADDGRKEQDDENGAGR